MARPSTFLGALLGLTVQQERVEWGGREEVGVVGWLGPFRASTALRTVVAVAVAVLAAGVGLAAIAMVLVAAEVLATATTSLLLQARPSKCRWVWGVVEPAAAVGVRVGVPQVPCVLYGALVVPSRLLGWMHPRTLRLRPLTLRPHQLRPAPPQRLQQPQPLLPPPLLPPFQQQRRH